VKVTLIYKPELEAIVRSLRAEGLIDAALREFIRHEPDANELEVFIEPAQIGWNVRVRGYHE
jgi:hypothetical protein